MAPINSFSPTPKLFDDSQIPAFKALADSVHAYGTKLGVQLFHPAVSYTHLDVYKRQAKVSAASGGNSEPKHDAGTATRHYRAFWQRRCRAAAAGAVLKP